MARTELGEAVFQAIKAGIEKNGFSLTAQNFPPNYPVSLRTVWNIRKGLFETGTLNKIPGIEVSEFFTLKINNMLQFGWVSEQIQANFAAWSTWKATGTQADADKFYWDSCDEAEQQGLSWFCVELAPNLQ